MFLRSRRHSLHYFLIADTSLTVTAATSPWETMQSLSNSHHRSDRTIFKTGYWHSKIPSQLPFRNWIQSSSVLRKFARRVLVIPLQEKHCTGYLCLSLFTARWLTWGLGLVWFGSQQKERQPKRPRCTLSLNDYLPSWAASQHCFRFL